MPNSTPKKEKSKFNASLFIIKRFKLLMIGVIIIFSLVGWFFFIKSNRERVGRVKAQELGILEQEVAAKRLKIQSLSSKTHDIMILKDLRLESLKEILSQEDSKEDLYMVLEQIIAEQGLGTVALSLGRAKPLAGYAAKESVFGGDYGLVQVPIVVIPVSLEIVDLGGNIGYQKIKAVLSSLRNKGRIFNVSSLELGSLEGQDRAVKESEGTSFKFNFDTFMLAKPADDS
jgi:hypothetical protein